MIARLLALTLAATAVAGPAPAQPSPSIVITPVGQAQPQAPRERTQAELHDDALSQCRAGGNPLVDGVCRRSEAAFRYQDSAFGRALGATGYLSVEIPRAEVVAAGFVTAPCTAWLVARNLALTASHCLTSEASELYGLRRPPPAGPLPGRMRARVTFGRQVGPDGEMTDPGQEFTVTHVAEVNTELDYAVLVLAPHGQEHAGDAHGVIHFMGTSDPEWTEAGARLYLTHFPAAGQQHITKDNTCAVMADFDGSASRLAHHCDTTGGSSGAPILTYARAHRLGSAQIADLPVAVALHTNGPEESITTELRLGTRLDAVLAASPLLSGLACERRFPGRIDCPPAAEYLVATGAIRPSHAEFYVTGFATGAIPLPALTVAGADNPVLRALVQATGDDRVYGAVRVMGLSSSAEAAPMGLPSLTPAYLAQTRGYNVLLIVSKPTADYELSGLVLLQPDSPDARRVLVVLEF